MHNNVVRLQAGPLKALYFMHGITGSSYVFVKILRHLNLKVAAYGINSLGFHGAWTPVATIEDLGRDYAQAILATDQTGPYIVVGWSIGAVIALETARALLGEAQGQVELIILDGTFGKRLPGQESVAEGAHGQPSWVWRRFVGNFIDWDLANSPFLEQLLSINELDDRLETIWTRGQTYKLPWFTGRFDARSFRGQFSYFCSLQRAADTYMPTPYEGRSFHYVAQSRHDKAQRARWERLARGPTSFIPVAGDHRTMILEESNCVRLSHQLRHVLTPLLSASTRS